MLEPSLRSALEDLPASVASVAAYHSGILDIAGLPVARPGKALRPALALACGRAAGGPLDVPTPPMVSAALAVELMHDFSLLHDDVMDGDQMRRHRPAAWTVFGVSRAVLAGDALLSLALSQAAAVGGDTLVNTFRQLCVGQGDDVAVDAETAARPGGSAGLAAVLSIAENKTGALLGGTCELGALAGGADSASAGLYQEFGRELGVAFQLIDDVLGIWGDPDRTGKPTRSDLSARKVTLPVAAALSAGGGAAAELRDLYSRQTELTEADIARAAQLVEEAGGRSWAQDESKRRMDAALAALSHAAPDPVAEAELHHIAALIVDRDH